MAKARRKRGVFGRIVIVFGVGFFWLCVATFLIRRWYFIHTTDREWREAIAYADSIDPAWRWDDVIASREQVPESENSALFIMDLFHRGLLPSEWYPDIHVDAQPKKWREEREARETAEAELLPMPEEIPETLGAGFDGLPPEVRPPRRWMRDLDRELIAVNAALPELLKLTGMPRGRFPLVITQDFLSTDLSQRNYVVTVAQVLQFEAIRRADRGDCTGALRCVHAMVNSARSIGDEPILISQLVRVRVLRLTVDTIERMLAQGIAAEAILASIQHTLEIEEGMPRMLIALRGDRAGMFMFYDEHVQHGLIPLSPKPGDPISRFELGLEDDHWAREARSDRLRMTTDLIEKVKLPPEQWDLSASSVRADGQRVLKASSYYPIHCDSVNSERQLLARLRSAIAAVAAERYRLAHGHWPESLNTLVQSNYLSKVPTDPFDGKPLRFIRTRSGVTIYSIGPDRIDDGGDFDEQLHRQDKGDYGIRLFDPKCRGLTPEPLPMPRCEN